MFGFVGRRPCCLALRTSPFLWLYVAQLHSTRGVPLMIVIFCDGEGAIQSYDVAPKIRPMKPTGGWKLVKSRLPFLHPDRRLLRRQGNSCGVLLWTAISRVFARTNYRIMCFVFTDWRVHCGLQFQSCLDPLLLNPMRETRVAPRSVVSGLCNLTSRPLSRLPSILAHLATPRRLSCRLCSAFDLSVRQQFP